MKKEQFLNSKFGIKFHNRFFFNLFAEPIVEKI